MLDRAEAARFAPSGSGESPPADRPTSPTGCSIRGTPRANSRSTASLRFRWISLVSLGRRASPPPHDGNPRAQAADGPSRTLATVAEGSNDGRRPSVATETAATAATETALHD